MWWIVFCASRLLFLFLSSHRVQPKRKKKKVHPAKNCWMYIRDWLSLYGVKNTHTHTQKKGGGNIEEEEEMNRMRETAHTSTCFFFLFHFWRKRIKKRETRRERKLYCIFSARGWNAKLENVKRWWRARVSGTREIFLSLSAELNEIKNQKQKQQQYEIVFHTYIEFKYVYTPIWLTHIFTQYQKNGCAISGNQFLIWVRSQFL